MTERTPDQLAAENRELHCENAALKNEIAKLTRMREALGDKEARLRTMADSSPVMIWVTGPDAGCEFANLAFCEFFDKRMEDVLGFKWQPLVHPDDVRPYVEALQGSIREREPFRAQARIRRADGEWRWVESHACPRFSLNGVFLGHVGISPDITDMKVAELTVRESEARFRQVAENIREVFWLTDVSKQTVIYISPAYEEIWGRPCESLY
jgi:PAS domain S-box-containing protein